MIDKSRNRKHILIMFFILMLLLIINSGGTSIKPQKINSCDDFVNEFRKKGYKVEEVVETTASCNIFTVKNKVIKDKDYIINIYEFQDEKIAKEKVSTIETKGFKVGTKYIDYKEAPHFYQSGRLIIFCGGNKFSVLRDIKSIMGKQIAGLNWYETLLFSSKGKKK